MPLQAIQNEILSRFERVRSGVAIGFDENFELAALSSLRGGVWRSDSDGACLPYADCQFDVAVISSRQVEKNVIREVHRVLRPKGCLFFTVDEKTKRQDGFTEQEIYRVIRDGFDILSIKRPDWWFFGKRGRTLTVCARKKYWREHKGFAYDETLPFTPFR